MTEQDLIKKLEQIKVPEIELITHKKELRTYLLKQGFKKESSKLGRQVLPMGLAFVVLLALVFNLTNFWQLGPAGLALAKTIAMKDSGFRSLIESGAVVVDIQMADSKAYMLVSLVEPLIKEEFDSVMGNSELLLKASSVAEVPESKSEFLVEINLKDKKVSQISEVTIPSSPLSDQDKEKAGLIADIPAGAIIQEIKPAPPQAKLIRKGNEIKAEATSKATVIYRSQQKTWQALVDIDKNIIESIEFIEKDATKD
ncbi:hypothetical protein L6250_02005 [Candidatus Parcubacteria bacterium]|nr:hypothetical protein [Patescibacteria group bacterium]MBU4466639.1 hypothetical protein [Patescibacteria group bacterium]MCG2688389.1 hypothetical protein [Candidatus Parcubacteria bacterium]